MRKYLCLLLILFVFSNMIFAQKDLTNTSSTNTNQQNLGSNSSSNQGFRINADAPDLINQFSSPTNSQLKTFPVDKSVNPDKYIVGPNDLFNLSIFGFVNQTIPLLVNLEGSLVIPSVGEVKVDGLSLTEVKSRVIKSVKKRYFSSEISLNLSTPRTFIIGVSSLVQKKIEVSPLTRTSDIIGTIFYDTLNVPKKTYRINNGKEFFYTEISLRNIEIIRKDGSVKNVDLYQYFSTNDDKYNPFFLEGDLLKIPFGQLSKNYITIEGAVQLSGVYEYNKDDNLKTIIGLARGFDTDAETDSISIYRMNPATKKYDVINLSYNDNIDYKISAFDRVFVKYKSTFIKNLSVTVLGEVERPGVYPITFKNTTIKDVIEMCGGFKSTAYLPLSIVFRRNDEEYSKRDTLEIFVNMRGNDLIINEKDKLNFERDILSRRNRMIVDFEKLFKENDQSQNIILEDRDVVYINDNKKVVYVYGQVNNEGYVPLKDDADADYYIEKAGGYSLAADKGDTRVIKFNSRGWYKVGETKIMSGDFIYVPKKTPAEFSQTFTIVATTIGIVTSLITTYLLIKQK